MDLRPAEIAMRQFSRRLFGADPAEVKQFLATAAGTLERVNGELARIIADRTVLQTGLKQRIAEVEDLRRQLADAQDRLASYQRQEGLMARAFLTAQMAAEGVTAESQAEAERRIAEAHAAAQETIQAARRSAAELLRGARTRAQKAIEAANRAAAARVAEARIETEQLVEEARRSAAEVQDATQQQVERFIARLEAFLSKREELSQRLDGLAHHHADSLEVMRRMHAEVGQTILPALRELMRPLAPVPAAAGASPSLQPTPSYQRVEPPPQRSANGGPGLQAPAPRPAGEIVASPIHSYLEATKFVTAVARIKGVKTARLRSYSKGSVIIDVATEAGTLADVEPRLIDGFPLRVVEATDRRLVLHLVPNGESQPPSGR